MAGAIFQPQTLPDACPPETLQHYKNQFATAINSKRKLSKISNIQQLQHLLIKRDEICIETPPTTNIQNQLNKQQTNSTIPNNHHEANSVPKNPNLVKVYRVIKDSIGHEWKEFARGLKIPEGRIDALSSLDARERIHKILLQHEEDCPPYNWRAKLLQALKQARRTDLEKSVTKLLDLHHIIQPNGN